jgi:predicted small metal-binding protein
MGKMSTCPCGFIVISPQGEEQVIKHMALHLRDVHPGSSMSEDEIRKTVKTV